MNHKLIYHGSGTQDIKELIPQIPRDKINKNEPCAIYAIAHRGMATILGFDAAELLKTFMCVNNTPNGPVINYFADMTEEELWSLDHSGSVYAFNEKDFVFHGNPSIAEYISEQPQKPVEEYVFDSLITEAIKQGVNIYCVSRELYEEIYNDMSQNDIVIERESLRPLSIKHDMRLHSEPFEKVKSGSKIIELRVFDEKRQKISVGDSITFTNRKNREKITKMVTNLHEAESFNNLFELGLSHENIGCKPHEDLNESLGVYYSQEDIEKYGVVGIEFR